MHPIKSRKPFTLFKKKTQNGLIWYVRFWNETSHKYDIARSTGIIAEGKKQRRYEAEQIAREIFSEIQIKHPQKETFIQYLENVWTQNSSYIKETGQSQPNLSNKISRDNFSEKDLKEIAVVLNCTFNAVFKMNDTGEEI
ncbi:MAG: hypothetical protein FWF38_05145 [Spirochaetaceae bacterium]|nr:hypothetical protein [Spirochaetaceae bacterium]